MEDYGKQRWVNNVGARCSVPLHNKKGVLSPELVEGSKDAFCYGVILSVAKNPIFY